MNKVSKRAKETPTLHMEYRNKKPNSQDSPPSYQEDSVMDAGAMGSVMPLKIAQENGFEIIRPRKRVSLETASGNGMDVQGVTIVWARARGARTYSKIVFIVSNEAQEILILLKHQVALWILSASYPRYLGDNGGETDESTEEEDIKIPRSQADTVTHGDRSVERERTKGAHDEEEKLKTDPHRSRR